MHDPCKGAPRVVKRIETESKILAARLWERGYGEFVFNRYRISIGKNIKVLELHRGDGCTT